MNTESINCPGDWTSNNDCCGREPTERSEPMNYRLIKTGRNGTTTWDGSAVDLLQVAYEQGMEQHQEKYLLAFERIGLGENIELRLTELRGA